MKIPNIIDMKNAKGIYLTGSYARGEETKESDIDLLVITDNINKTEKKGKYEITYVSNNELKGINSLIYYPMLKEAKTIKNNNLKLRLIKILKSNINKKILKEYLRNTRDMLKLNQLKIKLAKLKNKKMNNSVGYSLILRLRTYYILECLKNGKKPNTKNFLLKIKSIVGNNKIYKSYKSWKNRQSINDVDIKDAELLLNYLNKETKKWQKEIKD